MSRKEYDLEFQPGKKRRMETLGRFLLGFGALALLLLVISVVAVQRDGLLDQILGVYFETTQPVTEEDPGVWKGTGSATFLLCETDEQGQALRFVMMLRADIARRELHIFPLSPKTKAPAGPQAANRSEITLEQALKEGGVKQLKEAVEALTESTVDRYVSAADSDFMKAINAMGSGVTVQVPERIRYRGADFSLTLAQGSQRLQGDMLLRYFRYLGTLKSGGAKAQGELLKTVLETYLIPANADTPERLENRFNTLVNILQTDISVVDFDAQRDLLLALLQNAKELKIDVNEAEGAGVR